MCIRGEDMHSQWGWALPVSHIPIPGEDESQWNKHPHQEWRCNPPRMAIWLTGNGNVPHWEWGCDSPGMGM